jgi:hypothetical protein
LRFHDGIRGSGPGSANFTGGGRVGEADDSVGDKTIESQRTRCVQDEKQQYPCKRS